MLSTVNTIPLNNERKEIVKHGTPGFPCNAYIGDIHNFIGGEISLHCHSELLQQEGHTKQESKEVIASVVLGEMYDVLK